MNDVEPENGHSVDTGKILRVLHLEDNPRDCELVEHAMESVGFTCRFAHAGNQAEFQAALEQGGFDLILSDFSIAGYDGSSALAMARNERPGVPFVFVSGTIGEERAVDVLKSGATDYVLKTHLEKLGPAVMRALRESETNSRRVLVEKELARERDLLQALLDNVPDRIYFKDAQSRFIKCSLGLARRLGLSSSGEMVGKTDFDFHPPDQAREYFNNEQEIIRTGQPLINKIEEQMDLDGHRVWASVTKVPTRDPTGNINGIIGISRDITAIKRAEEELILFRSLVDRSNDAIEVIDPETGRYLDVNERACSAHGYTREEYLSLTVQDIDPMTAARSWREAVDEAKRAGSRVFESQHRRKDGSVFPVEVNSTYIRLDREYLLAVVRDISERKRLEDELRQSQKMESIGQLAGGVAHDFNNILTVINGHASLLLDAEDLSPEVSESLKMVYTAGERAARLTQQLLAFSRKRPMCIRVIDLNHLIVETVALLQRLIGENITLEVTSCPGLAFIQADAGMMEQILLNLSVNARDAMPRGGRLTIGTELITIENAALRRHSDARNGEFICLRVSDTGNGIAPEVLPRIFEPYFTTKGIGKGTGLGLATVFGVVKQHQGWIEVESRIGAGTTFRVFLPRSSGGVAPNEAVAASLVVGGGSETILLVEDELPVRQLAVAVLQKYGYRVLQAGSGPDAMEVWKWHSARISLLMTDMVMPDGMTGFELASALQAQRPSLKIIYTSGYSDEMVGEVFAIQNKIHFLGKPYQPGALAKIVRDVLDAPNGSQP